MNDNLPPLPAPEAWRTRVGPWGDHSTDYAYTVNQMREYAAQAVAERDAEIAAEQRRSEVYVDLVRRTAEALGLTREDGWHKLPEQVEALRADADKHYAAGWIAAAKWAERDDLISDIDSPAYIADRDAAIDNARSKE